MIRIKNIYYMLSYAFSVLNENGYSNIAAEEFENTADLLAAILAKGIAWQIKRGLGKVYVNISEQLCVPTGKIDVASSVKKQTMLKKQLVCEFDEYTENAYINQILKTTSLLLLRAPAVAKKQKQALKKNMFYFEQVDILRPHDVEWTAIKYHRNNATYKMLINICNLIVCGMLLSEQAGSKKHAQYIDDQHMHSLYERFLLQYFRKHYPEFTVSAAQIEWNVDDGIFDLLPLMKSDITLEYGGKTLIIDAKYYSHTMQKNTLYNTKTLHSHNLYQIFTYVKNKDKLCTGCVSGVLIYAKTDEELTPDNDYNIGGNKFGVKTLDLDADWSVIKNQLDALVLRYFEFAA